MPSYYNPYQFYQPTYNSGAMYPQQMPQMPQQSYAQQPQLKSMEWVEGEVGAKAFQMPAGWPANQPIPLWDSTDTVIYLKSWGPMGVPNPMQKLKYEMPEQQNMMTLPSGQSGGSNSNGGYSGNSGDYASKSDIDGLREEIRSLRSSMSGAMNGGNQNGSHMNGSGTDGGKGNNGNRGGL